MKNIKLHHVFLSFVALIAILLTVSWVIPEKGVNVMGVNLKFPTFNQLMHPKRQQTAQIDSLIVAIDTSFIEPLVKHRDSSSGTMGAPDHTTFSINNATSIFKNDAGIKNLHHFFQQLNQLSENKEKIHLLHYGDSQIEGDRMTNFIRERLQNQFGGNGPGLIPATNVYSTVSFYQTFSENFKRYTCFGGDRLENGKYGVMGSAARFSPEIDSNTVMSNQEITAWVEISASKRAYHRSRDFNTIKMFYNSCYYPCALNVYENGHLIHQDSLLHDSLAHIFELSFPKTPGKLKFEFKSVASPTISNFSLEGDYGLQVSNIGLRGSSGTIFGKMDRSLLRKTMSELDVELIIMQFGGNSVPAFEDSSNVRNYARYFKGQLYALKSIRPSAAIIVIGPSDMSKLTDGIYETYELLPYCIDQMKKVSLEVGAGYWDLYAAMGGKNSMPAWVEKGLAGKDYVHFSVGGARMVAQLFYEAFMMEFVNWDKQNQL